MFPDRHYKTTRLPQAGVAAAGTRRSFATYAGRRGEKLFLCLGLVAVVTMAGGCDRSLVTRFLTTKGESDDRGPHAIAQRPGLALAANGPVTSVDETNPSVVATAFLEAVRDGHAEQARQWLTDRAQTVLDESHIQLVAPGSPDATFHVGGPQFVASDPRAAHLTCRWSDTSDARMNSATEFILAMRRSDPDQTVWRIVGLVQPTASSPRIFSFETSGEISDLARQ